MNKPKIFSKFILKALFVLFSFFIDTSYAKTVILGTTAWPPYVQNTPMYKGYIYDTVLAAFKEVGYDVRVIFMPWQDAQNAVNTGQIDAIFPEYFSTNNLANLFYTQPFSDSPVGLCKKRHQNPNKDIDFPHSQNAMKKYRFGVVKGYTNIRTFDDNHQLNKISVDSDLNNLKQLYQEHVDLIFIDQYTAEYLLNNKLPLSYRAQLTFMMPPLAHKRLYVAVSKKNPLAEQIVSDFNQGLKMIKNNGMYNTIIDRDAAIRENPVI